MNGLQIRNEYPKLRLPVNHKTFTHEIVDTYLEMVESSLVYYMDYDYSSYPLPTISAFNEDGDYDDMIAEITAQETYGMSFQDVNSHLIDSDEFYYFQGQISQMFDMDVAVILNHYNLSFYSDLWEDEYKNFPIKVVW